MQSAGFFFLLLTLLHHLEVLLLYKYEDCFRMGQANFVFSNEKEEITTISSQNLNIFANAFSVSSLQKLAK
jgi:hypothetical protein